MKDPANHDFFEHPEKLRWACRRGMLELDVLLGNFLSEAYPELAREDKKRFVALLNCSDPELFAWLMGSATPEDSDLARITEIIHSHALSRF
ncbi:Antitoxin CptB [Aquicella siphonis]|uniref:FAD assembly factor SdhE n=1 Tax=Aquicella siphonis TaxID=254247 RepID=A0A5E4PFX0_9COXI|nr:succinate dehydrogenase assembly factor 2 [Aquicella siphonis]VVC75809.1 Antitoxin CptB [Aquicella siphonis]